MTDYVDLYKRTIIKCMSLYINDFLNASDMVIVLDNLIPFILKEKNVEKFNELYNEISLYNLDEEESLKMKGNYLTEKELKSLIKKYIKQIDKKIAI